MNYEGDTQTDDGTVTSIAIRQNRTPAMLSPKNEQDYLTLRLID